ncbi:hypothetical protein BSNT_10588 [Bacillus subtilis subsp. natto BEST195]|nr:hypothetical protein BSNT_10588 [Bacillus subtilis subsp. natto BEST195]
MILILGYIHHIQNIANNPIILSDTEGELGKKIT